MWTSCRDAAAIWGCSKQVNEFLNLRDCTRSGNINPKIWKLRRTSCCILKTTAPKQGCLILLNLSPLPPEMLAEGKNRGGVQSRKWEEGLANNSDMWQGPQAHFPPLYMTDDIAACFYRQKWNPWLLLNMYLHNLWSQIRHFSLVLNSGNEWSCALPAVIYHRRCSHIARSKLPCNSGEERVGDNVAVSQKLCQQLGSQREKQSLWFGDSRAANWQPSWLDLLQEAAGGWGR